MQAGSREDQLLGRLREATRALRETLDERDALASERNEPIAIVGMGCRFPGGAKSPEAYWHLLAAGGDAVVSLDPRWALIGARPSSAAPGWAGLLGEAVDVFDPAFFGIAPREARSMDPQHRLLLEVSWEALEDAGIPPRSLDRSRTGVFIGACSSDYAGTVMKQPPAEHDAYGTTGNLLSIAAGRIAYTLGLQGPCLTIDTACSSSLTAIHLACRSLREKESDLALAGGVSLILSADSMDAVTRLQALSPDGRCRTFDAAASGFARGEGCGLVILKRLSDARRDRDRIWALIRGSAVNQDGRSTGLTAPNVLAQESLLRQALANARVSAGAIGYVETHGTGTALGDPIEFEALRAVLGEPREDGSRCTLGAVKTNLGHLEAAAGVAGLIKTALILWHERIPKNLHFRSLNAHIELAGTALTLATDPQDFRRGDAPRFAGVSSFALSGSNAHVVMEEAPPPAPSEPAPERSAELVILSGKSEAALQEQAALLRQTLIAQPGRTLVDLAYSLATTRSHFEHRLALVASSLSDLHSQLEHVAQGGVPPGAARGHVGITRAPRVVFVFPGQGSQWLEMGRSLLTEERVFRAAIEACDHAIFSEAGFSILTELQADEETSQLSRIDVVQPLLFAMGVALAELWRSWGVEPDAVVGHSLGEVAAAHVAGALSLTDAVAIICRRSRLLRRISGSGEMALVELSRADAERELDGYQERLSVAVSNSQRATVIAGDGGALAEVLSKLEARGVFCRRVKVDVASHSPQVEPLRTELLEMLSRLAPRRASIPMLSTVNVEFLRGPELDAEYWARNLRQPVRFAEAVQTLLASGHGLFVEMSPHPILSPAIEELRQTQKREGAAVGSLRRGQPERAELLRSLGALWTKGYQVAWKKQFPDCARRVPLPTYPWQRQRYWAETAVSELAGSSSRAHSGGHPLLGASQILSTQTNTHLWETTLELARLPWLGDHRVQGSVIFPGAAYVEMALAAGTAAFGLDPFVIGELGFIDALALSGNAAARVQVVTIEEPPGRVRFQVARLQEHRGRTLVQVHCRGVLRRAERRSERSRLDLAALRKRLSEIESTNGFYEKLGAMGLQYGPAFQGLQKLWRSGEEALGRVRLPDAAGSPAGYRFHPALLDACMQVVAGCFDAPSDGTPWVPVEVGSFRLSQPPHGELYCHVHMQSDPTEASAHRRKADVCITDGTGVIVAELQDLLVQRLEATRKERSQDLFYLGVEWEAAPIPAAQQAAGRWLLLGDADGLGSGLCAALREAGHDAVQRSEVPQSVAGLRALLGNAFDGKPPTGVVYLGSLEGSRDAGDPRTEEALRGCEGALCTVQALVAMGYRDAPRLWLLTRGAQAVGSEEVAVMQAPLLGLGRTVALEQEALRCSRVDLDPSRPDGEISALLNVLLAGDAEEEVAFRAGERCAARLVRRQPGDLVREKQEPAQGRPFRLEMDHPGVLDRIALCPIQRRPPAAGEVEVAVEAAGLNYLDVLLALGVIPGAPATDKAPLQLGSEYAGRITAVGEGVHGLAPGDPVMALGQGTFSSHLITRAAFVVPRPRELSAVQAAALPVAFLTAYYALDRVARLQKGERVLIHCATGGVGLAAVQWARHIGAEIHATAGTAEKRAYLQSLGVKYVSDSRSDRFVSDLMEWTQGEGVDVVLNSLSGELLQKSFELLREHGRFVELGKRDAYANSPLAMRPFLRNLSFALVDLQGLSRQHPARVRAWLEELLDLVGKGTLVPPKIETVPIGRAGEAFRKMAQAQHLGKLVLTFEEPEVQLHVSAANRVPVDRDSSYLITGGLGGLGLRVAGWLAQHGAGHLVLMGRSGADFEDQQAAVAALRSSGTRVTVARADVADRAQVEAVLRETDASGMPLRGVIHAAAILDDAMLPAQTPERFRAVFAAKVQGAWNLHQLTRAMPLQFFVMYASAAGLLGAPGQSNYAAANAFLDALAHHRKAQGLPALSIDWGAFSGVGLAAMQEQRGARLAARGMRSMTPEEGLEVLGGLLASSEAQMGVAPLDLRQWAAFHQVAAESPRLSRLRAASSEAEHSRRGDQALLTRLESAEPAARPTLLLSILRAEAERVLRIPAARLDVNAPLSSLGLDSLMGLELRNRIESALGIRVPATVLWTYPTLTALSGYLVQELVPGGNKVADLPAVPEVKAESAAVDLDDAALFALLDDEFALARKHED